jgi:formyltetrahydrofolate synthetase
MGKMKELISNKAEEIALEKYGSEFYELTQEAQDEVWKLAEQEASDYLASLADAERERGKYE